jgi:HK97 family phage portal protein
LGVSPNGTPLSDDLALAQTAVYGSVRIIAEGLANLAPAASVIAPDGRSVPAPVPAWVTTPNADTDAHSFIADLAVSLLLRGNAFAAITRQGMGAVSALHVLDPDRLNVTATPAGLTFTVDGKGNYTRDQVAHAHLLRKPGHLLGLSPVQAAASAIAISRAGSEYTTALLDNHVAPGTIVSTPGSMSEQALATMRASFLDRHHGPRAGGLGVLTEGATISRLAMSAADAEVLATRKWTVSDISRVFGVPLHLLGDSTGSHASTASAGMAQQNQSFALYTLAAYAARVGALLTGIARSVPRADPTLTVALSLDSLLKVDITERYAAYAAAIEAGFMTPDEARAAEGLTPLPRAAAPTSTGPVIG